VTGDTIKARNHTNMKEVKEIEGGREKGNMKNNKSQPKTSKIIYLVSDQHQSNLPNRLPRTRYKGAAQTEATRLVSRIVS